MKERLIVHTSLFFALLLLVGLFKQWFSSYELSSLYRVILPFLYGAIIGSLLPYLDHLIYVYGIRPEELTSQRVRGYFSKGNLVSGIKLLFASHDERNKFILHTAHFQLIFVLVSFWVVSSGASIFGKGVVVFFLLHLVVEQILQLNEKKNINNWFYAIPFDLSKKQQILYVGVNLVLVLLLALFL
ncbi:MAG: hypothetical protein NZM26_01365 [Patescibacteria group bacterium]|nr:hypothetical protein [Patescibacteria group bacterium]